MEMPRAWTAAALERRIGMALLAGSLLKASRPSAHRRRWARWDRQPVRSAGRLANYLSLHAWHFAALALEESAQSRNYRRNPKVSSRHGYRRLHELVKQEFIHLSQLRLLIGGESHILFILKGWPCSPCRSPLAELVNCPGLFSTRLATRDSPHDRRQPCSGTADGHGDSPDDGTQHRAQLSRRIIVLNRAVWSPLTASRRSSGSSWRCTSPAVSSSLASMTPSNADAASRSQPRYLPRPRAVLAHACGQSQWPALARVYAPDAPLLG